MRRFAFWLWNVALALGTILALIYLLAVIIMSGGPNA